MKPEASAYTIFNAALEELDPAARALYLNEACGTDAALRERVEKLLQAHGEAGGFFSQPLNPTAPVEPVLATVSLTIEKAGDAIGRYKLLEQIGEGGCGVVYMAEQQEPVRRRVALKVIKLGMDTKQVVARFEAERQALALMDHPNIARVLDAGATETGRPYFVMELVRGIKITEFCDQKKLSTQERLELFISVCRAVQHAHQKGIIHRDLKPSNILVTIVDGVPVPKVIDFGIAKATSNQPLTDKTLFTAFAQFVGTPAYMSPEQAEMSGVDIDTRTDIYSLGVVLYELLTGRTPFDAEALLRAGIDEIRRTIRDKEPLKPSTRLHTLSQADLTTTAQARHVDGHKLKQTVKGDLDWIVMKCLEKERSRRYETVNGLALDVKRHLNNEPVLASPPSKLYDFQKTVRRHKVGFAATAAIIIVLAVGIVMTTWQAVRATRAEREQTQLRRQADEDRRRAETEAAKSTQVATFLKEMLESVRPAVAMGRDTTMVREILDHTAERIRNELKAQPEVDAELRTTIGLTYLRLAEAAKAETMHREALQLRRALFGETNLLVAASLHELARALNGQGTTNAYQMAEAAARQAVAIRRQLLGNDNREVALSLDLAATAVARQGKLSDAETLYREALAMWQKLFGGEHLDVAGPLVGLGTVLRTAGKFDEAEVCFRRALEIRKKHLGATHPHIAYTLGEIGALLLKQKKPQEAEVVIRETLEMEKRILGHEHGDTIITLNLLAQALEQQGKLAEAEIAARDVLTLRKKLLGEDHAATKRTAAYLAKLLRLQGKSE